MAVNSANAYDFDMFEVHGTSAPARERETSSRPPLRRVAPKSSKAKKGEERACMRRSFGLIAVFAVIFVAVALQIYPKMRSNELSKQISRVNSEIEVARAENVRLNAELNGITSIAKVDNYATEILGMTKLENYQVKYIDLSVGDRVLYSAAAANLRN